MKAGIHNANAVSLCPWPPLLIVSLCLIYKEFHFVAGGNSFTLSLSFNLERCYLKPFNLIGLLSKIGTTNNAE